MLLLKSYASKSSSNSSNTTVAATLAAATNKKSNDNNNNSSSKSSSHSSNSSAEHIVSYLSVSLLYMAASHIDRKTNSDSSKQSRQFSSIQFSSLACKLDTKQPHQQTTRFKVQGSLSAKASQRERDWGDQEPPNKATLYKKYGVLSHLLPWILLQHWKSSYINLVTWLIKHRAVKSAPRCSAAYHRSQKFLNPVVTDVTATAITANSQQPTDVTATAITTATANSQQQHQQTTTAITTAQQQQKQKQQ